MKMIRFLLPLMALGTLGLTSGFSAVLITGFGTGEFASTFSDFSTDTQTSNSYRVVGNDTNSLFGDVVPVSILDFTSPLELTAVYTGSSTAPFEIELYDSVGNALRYQGDFTQFVASVPTTVSLAFAEELGTFNGTVEGMGLLTGGTGDPVDLTLDSLTAVPEPSSGMLLFYGTMVLLCWQFFGKRRLRSATGGC